MTYGMYIKLNKKIRMRLVFDGTLIIAFENSELHFQGSTVNESFIIFLAFVLEHSFIYHFEDQE